MRDETEGTIVSSILTALEKFVDIFAIAGDMPCADPQMIDAMLQSFNGKAVVPLKEDKQIEPMHAIYCSSTVSVLKKNIEERRLSIREFIEAIPHSFFNIPRNREFSFYNVNYPSDLVYIQRNGCQ